MIEEVRLDDLITLQRGFDISEKEQLEGNVPVISSGGFSSYHNEYKVTGPGVVIGRKGTLGKVFYTTENYWPHSTSLWVKDFKGNDPKFIYYLLQVLHFEKFDSGAANPTLNRNHIHSLKIKVPKKKYRSPIASILSAYDELIENNKQRIKLLEEMAEEIYKEWFVRLRFPNYENTEFLDGLPKGWEIVEIKNAFDILGGGTPSTDVVEFWKDGTINWFSPTDITNSKSIFLNNSSKQITNSGLINSSAKLFPAKSVMMTSRATIGAVGINLTQACTNQGFITCLSNDNFSYPYIYSWIKSNKDLINSYTSGATFKEISRGVFKNLKILKPELQVSEKYYSLIEPIFEEINILGQKNQLLQQTRDLLLPRLISGKLSVEGLAEAKEYVLGQNADPWPMAAEAEGEYHHS